MDVGLRGVGTNDGNDEHAALGLFFTSVDNDPPTVAVARTRSIVQIVG